MSVTGWTFYRSCVLVRDESVLLWLGLGGDEGSISHGGDVFGNKADDFLFRTRGTAAYSIQGETLAVVHGL